MEEKEDNKSKIDFIDVEGQNEVEEPYILHQPTPPTQETTTLQAQYESEEPEPNSKCENCFCKLDRVKGVMKYSCAHKNCSK